MNLQILRISCLAFIFSALLAVPALSQLQSWSDPESITDSLADNRNALIMLLPFNNNYDHYLFWERSADSTSTAIYYRNFYEADEPVAMLEEANVHFRNPHFIVTSELDEDTLFYFFYESDQNGNYDIFYQVYTTLGFGDPVLLAGSQEDESHFRCNGSGMMVWQEGDRIRYARLTKWNSPFVISNPITIDSIDCSAPDVPPAGYWSNPSYIAWLKSGTENSSVLYSEYSGTWSPPIVMYDTGYNASLRFAMEACYGDGSFGATLLWENVDSGHYTIMARDFWDGDYISAFSQDSSFHPMICVYMIPVDELWTQGFMTFVNASEQNGDIYVNDNGWGVSPNLEDYGNLSDSPYEETNPSFFNGRCSMYFCDLIDIWESSRNGHWQLFYSKSTVMCGGGMPETTELSTLSMIITPNPARDACEIRYTLPEDSYVSLSLCGLDGRQWVLSENSYEKKGDHVHYLDLHRQFPGLPASGLFLIRLVTGKQIVIGKIVKISQ